MPKDGNKTRKAYLLISIAVIFAGLVTTWALYGDSIKDNTEDIVKLDLEGSKPAKRNTFAIVLVKKDVAVNTADIITNAEEITTIQEFHKESMEKQQKSYEEILRRLPK